MNLYVQTLPFYFKHNHVLMDRPSNISLCINFDIWFLLDFIFKCRCFVIISLHILLIFFLIFWFFLNNFLPFQIFIFHMGVWVFFMDRYSFLFLVINDNLTMRKTFRLFNDDGVQYLRNSFKKISYWRNKLKRTNTTIFLKDKCYICFCIGSRHNFKN